MLLSLTGLLENLSCCLVAIYHVLASVMLKGSLETVASDKPINFFISAEDDANVQYPVGQVVLKTGPFDLED